MFFEFNGFNSNEYNLAIETIPPIAFTEGTNENSIPIQFAKMNNEDDLINLKKAFRGNGELVLSTMPKNFFKVTNTTLVEVRKNKDYTVYLVVFEVDGEIYLDNGKDIISLEENHYILYNDFFECEPRFKIYCNGNGILIVNDIVIKLTNIYGEVIIDSSLEDCFTDSGFANNNVELNIFPRLTEGENIINYSGSITRIELIPNWRC